MDQLQNESYTRNLPHLTRLAFARNQQVVDFIHLVKLVEVRYISVHHIEILMEAMILRKSRLQVCDRQRFDPTGSANTEVI